MAFIPVPLTTEVVFNHILDGEPVVNVLNFFANAETNAAAAQSLANVAAGSWTTNIMPLLTAQMEFVSCDVRYLGVADGAQATGNPIGIVTGGVGGDAYPANVALCMTHRTNLAGRSRRGRTYFGGIPESAGQLNSASASFQLNLAGAFANVLADIDALGYVLVVVSRFANGAPRAQGLSTAVTTSLFRDGRFDSMRGRLPG